MRGLCARAADGSQGASNQLTVRMELVLILYGFDLICNTIIRIRFFILSLEFLCISSSAFR